MGTIEAMNRDNVIQTLRGHEAELRAAGVVRLSLFGSTARGDSRPDSDIDLLAVFDDTRRLSLLDVIHIQNQIADLLGAPVDLIEEGTLKPRVQKKCGGRGRSCLLAARYRSTFWTTSSASNDSRRIWICKPSGKTKRRCTHRNMHCSSSAKAAVKLGDLAPELCPEIDWRNIRGLGNRLRHECDNVDMVRGSLSMICQR